jgi:hypothetical protein
LLLLPECWRISKVYDFKTGIYQTGRILQLLLHCGLDDLKNMHIIEDGKDKIVRGTHF